MLELDKDLKEEQGKDLRERFIDVIKNYMSEAYALGKMSKDDCKYISDTIADFVTSELYQEKFGHAKKVVEKIWEMNKQQGYTTEEIAKELEIPGPLVKDVISTTDPYHLLSSIFNLMNYFIFVKTFEKFSSLFIE